MINSILYFPDLVPILKIYNVTIECVRIECTPFCEHARAHPRPERVNEICKILGIKAPIVPLNLIAIGHPAEEKEPRTQYDESRVHREKW